MKRGLPQPNRDGAGPHDAERNGGISAQERAAREGTASTPFARAIAQFRPGLPLAVAFSGGADSTALLLACAEQWPGQVRALHVHHGLQDAADAFERHCTAVCAALGVPLAVHRVAAHAAPGQSPEQAARAARYQAFFEHFSAGAQAESADPAIKDIAIAHHADDQVETMLLALSRGAGLPGLAAMPACWRIDGLTFHRPLLAVPAADVRAWLAHRGVPWIEDPSNADERFTRNRIRAKLLPALATAFPQCRDHVRAQCGACGRSRAIARGDRRRGPGQGGRAAAVGAAARDVCCALRERASPLVEIGPRHHAGSGPVARTDRADRRVCNAWPPHPHQGRCGVRGATGRAALLVGCARMMAPRCIACAELCAGSSRLQMGARLHGPTLR